MEIRKTAIDGVLIIENHLTNDGRGSFVKSYNAESFEIEGIDLKIQESYYSVSRANVIRGMHFQLPPYEHNKMIYVAKGAVNDVVLDLREKSKTYKQHVKVELSGCDSLTLFIPKGCAHGFKSLVDDTITVYNVDSVYNTKYDSGIHFESFGFDWETENPIISERDDQLIDMNGFLLRNTF